MYSTSFSKWLGAKIKGAEREEEWGGGRRKCQGKQKKRSRGQGIVHDERDRRQE